MGNDAKIKYLLAHSVSGMGVELSGLAVLGIVRFLNLIEDTGTIKLCENILNEIVLAEETQNSDMILGSTEQWSDFEKEKVPEIKKSLKHLITYVNRHYVTSLLSKTDTLLSSYLSPFTPSFQANVVLISPAILKIASHLKTAWTEMDFIYPNQKLSISPYASVRLPDLLDRERKTNSIELEIDMFASRKYRSLTHLKPDRYAVIKTLGLGVFRSLYELIRLHPILTLPAFQQLHADVYFLYTCVKDWVRLEDIGLINGMVNQVMTDALLRSPEGRNFDIDLIQSMVKQARDKLNGKSKGLPSAKKEMEEPEGE